MVYIAVNSYKNMDEILGYSLSIFTIIVVLYKLFFASLDQQILLNKIKHVDYITEKYRHINIQKNISKLQIQSVGWSYLATFILFINIFKLIGYSPKWWTNIFIVGFINLTSSSLKMFMDRIAGKRFIQFATNKFLR